MNTTINIKINLKHLAEEMLREKTYVFYKRNERPNFWVSKETILSFLKDYFESFLFIKIMFNQKSIYLILNQDFLDYLKVKLNLYNLVS